MPHSPQIEFERVDDSAQVADGGGHGEIPVEDPPPAEHPEEAPPENQDELLTRESKKAFERAIARLAPG